MADSLHVLVTGSNRGLGLEFARRYLERGDRVVATCRDPDGAAELLELVGRHGDHATVNECDITDAASCAALAAVVPWDRIDLLLHNAGVFVGREDDIEEIDFAEIEQTFRVNAIGPLRITRALWNKLGQGSKVVAITSKMGSISDNSSGGNYGYRMSKAALNMAVRCLGHECRPRGIVTFTIHPGWVRTDMGGSSAPLSIEESVGAMIGTIDSRGVEHDGMFFDKDGEMLPW